MVNVRIKIIPAPLGFPTDFEPLIAYARPASLGRLFFPREMEIHVRKKANNTLKKVTSFI
jgi:hypothetical protein